MTKIRFRYLFLLLAAFALIAAGCGSDDDDDTAEPAAATESTDDMGGDDTGGSDASGDDTGDDMGADDTGGSDTGGDDMAGETGGTSDDMGAMQFEGEDIVVSYMQSGTYDAAANDLADSFTDATGAEVDIVAQPFELLTQSYVTDLATGTGQFDFISASSWIADQFPQLLPLEGLYDPDDFPGFIPELLQPGRAAYDGDNLVGIPYAVDAYGVFYRTDLFEAAGVSADWTTWDEFYETLDVLAPTLDDDVSPLVFAYGASEQIPAIWVAAYDGYFIDENDRFAVDPGPAADALEYVLRGLEYSPDGATALSIDEANAIFNEGKAAVLIGWPSFNRPAANNSEVTGGNWALGSLPGPGFPWLSLWQGSIAKTSDVPEATYEWIKAYINPERSTENMAEYGMGSPFLSTYSDPELLEANAHDYPIQAENLAKALNVSWNFPAFEVAFRALGEMVVGNLTPEETVQAWHDGWAAIDPPPATLAEAEVLGFKQGS